MRRLSNYIVVYVSLEMRLFALLKEQTRTMLIIAFYDTRPIASTMFLYDIVLCEVLKECRVI